MALSPLPKKKLIKDEQEESEQTGSTGTPVRYLPLDRVYSASSCYTASGSSNVMSKKVKARKLNDSYDDEECSTQKIIKPVMIQSYLHVYTRRKKHKPEPIESDLKTESNLVESRAGELENGDESGESSRVPDSHKNRRHRNFELHSLGIDSKFSNGIGLSKGRLRIRSRNSLSTPIKKQNLANDCKDSFVSDQVKKWLELSYEDVDPSTFIGLQCQVYWPLDDEWYFGRVASYNSETKQHKVKYDDGDEESLFISNEKVKFYISREEMQQLNLKDSTARKDVSGLNNDELLALAAIFEECGDVEPGDVIWGKLSGHAMWPAVVVNEADVGQRKGLKPIHGERSVPVQFFGTHDFAWISMKQVVSFLRGLHLSYHLRCRQTRFKKSLEEAKLYLTEQTLPNKMLLRQNGIEVDDYESGGDTGSNSSDGELNCVKTCPFEIEGLRVISLGKVVTDSEHFHDDQDIWPEGYTAERKFTSTTDPGLESCYKMEVLRDPDTKFRPFFRVTMDSKEEFKGATPAACWNKIYRRIKNIGVSTSNGYSAAHGVDKKQKSGSEMFGFSIPKVSKLIKELSNYRKSSIYSSCKLTSRKYQDLPVGYRPVHLEWKDLDKCNVCHMDEEYTNNMFLQCDKCLMMVHARCYGESEPVDGALWLCNLCRSDAQEFPPPCCLCPVVGGAMKPTTDNRWAHLACAIWIPETCLKDIKRMEPIDGLDRINKDRWKLLCSICGVAYGACIQCSNSTCYVAYHPLCARAADLCVQIGDEDKLHLLSMDEDEDNQCIPLLSFCKKHRQPSNERSPSTEQLHPIVPQCSKFVPPLNQSGCARSEPYDFLGRRGRKEPEAVAAASLKRLYVENRPYLVTGFCQNGTLQTSSSSNEILSSRFSSCLQKSKLTQPDTSKGVLNMVEKYTFMKETVRTRLTFGKSGIHRFGVFAKVPHKAGDMVIEYTGELVRGSIADRRERFIYDSLVGAGTYMFRIDDERVIDATRAGSIAQLINHSCEPNCYSRGVTINGVEHIIIFAKRDIRIQEELTYDYRFFSIGEQLACYCGFPRCRGIVNDIEGAEQGANLWVPYSELIDWKGDKL